MKTIYSLLITISLFNTAQSQSTVYTEESRFDSRQNAAHYSIENTSSGNLVVAGTLLNNNTQGNILHLSSTGAILWEINLFRNGGGAILDIDVKDDLIAVTGYINSINGQDIFATLVDLNSGSVINSQIYTDPNPEIMGYGFNIQFSENHEFIYLGGGLRNESPPPTFINTQRAVLLRLDMQLSILNVKIKSQVVTSCPRDFFYGGYNGIIELDSDHLFAFGGHAGNGSPVGGSYLGQLLNNQLTEIQDVSESFRGVGSSNLATDAYFDYSQNLLHVLLNYGTTNIQTAIVTYEFTNGMLIRSNTLSFKLNGNENVRGYSLAPSSKADEYSVVGIIEKTDPSTLERTEYTFATTANLNKNRSSLSADLFKYIYTETISSPGLSNDWLEITESFKSNYTPEMAINDFTIHDVSHIVSNADVVLSQIPTNTITLENVFDLISDNYYKYNPHNGYCIELLETTKAPISYAIDIPCNEYDSYVMIEIPGTLTEIPKELAKTVICTEDPDASFMRKKFDEETNNLDETLDIVIKTGIDLVSLNSNVDANTNYTVFDASGRVIQNGQIAAYQSVTLSNISKGVYLLRIQDSEGKITSKKFAKY